MEPVCPQDHAVKLEIPIQNNYPQYLKQKLCQIITAFMTFIAILLLLLLQLLQYLLTLLVGTTLQRYANSFLILCQQATYILMREIC